MAEALDQVLSEKTKRGLPSKPQFFSLQKEGDHTTLQKLLAEGKIQGVVDDYEEQLFELFQVNNPTLVYTPNFKESFAVHLNEVKVKLPLSQQGKWVYFPWSSTLVHILDETAFFRVRTARNRNLIPTDEQEKFYNAVIGIGGLSVGNSVALAIVLQGGAKHIKLADHDRLALSNTNRIRAGVDSLGLPKVEMTARQIYALNPYAEVELFPEGLTTENIEKFFSGPPKLDLVIDELDNLAVKYLIREYARRHRTPVIMGADNGDNAIIDIERHDLDPHIKFFHGALGETTYEELKNLDKFGIGKTITKMLGAENITIRMQQSLLEMGRTLVSWPQLGGAALLNGIAMAYCARKIVNKQMLENERSILSMDEKLDPSSITPEAKAAQDKASQEFKKIFGL